MEDTLLIVFYTGLHNKWAIFEIIRNPPIPFLYWLVENGLLDLSMY